MAITNKWEEGLNTKDLAKLSDKQREAFNKCAEIFKGMNFYEAEKVLFTLIDAAKKNAIVN